MARKKKEPTIRLLHLRTDGSAVFVRVANDLESLQRLVGGYIEPVFLSPLYARPGLLGLCDEEGSLKQPPRPRNPFERLFLARGRLVGDLVVLRQRPPEFASLMDPDCDVLAEDLVLLGFAEPERVP